MSLARRDETFPATGKLEQSCSPIVTVNSVPVPCVAKEAEVVKLPERIQVFPWFLWRETARYLCFGGMLQTHQNGVLEADLSPNAYSAPVSVDSCELVT